MNCDCSPEQQSTFNQWDGPIPSGGRVGQDATKCETRQESRQLGQPCQWCFLGHPHQRLEGEKGAQRHHWQRRLADCCTNCGGAQLPPADHQCSPSPHKRCAGTLPNVISILIRHCDTQQLALSLYPSMTPMRPLTTPSALKLWKP